jgi:hypothetical protein
MQCSATWPQAEWCIQGCWFQHDLKVLPIHTYDLILGMDWLEFHSPMKVHWHYKWLSITYQGSSVMLYGSSSSQWDGLLIQVAPVDHTEREAPVSALSPDIAALLDQFPHVVLALATLPPPCPCDHAIPLVAGAKHVSVRPYRYPSGLKDEIER